MFLKKIIGLITICSLAFSLFATNAQNLPCTNLSPGANSTHYYNSPETQGEASTEYVPEYKDVSETTMGVGGIRQIYFEDGDAVYLNPETHYDISGEDNKKKFRYYGEATQTIHSKTPVFFVRVESGALLDRIKMVSLKSQKGYLEYEPYKANNLAKMGILGLLVANPNGKPNTIAIEISDRGNNLYRVTPEKKLKKGHYAIIYDTESAPVIYAFEVKK